MSGAGFAQKANRGKLGKHVERPSESLTLLTLIRRSQHTAAAPKSVYNQTAYFTGLVFSCFFDWGKIFRGQ